MVGPRARAYMGRLWALLDMAPMDQAKIESIRGQMKDDAQLTDVERASLLAMLEVLIQREAGDESSPS